MWRWSSCLHHSRSPPAEQRQSADAGDLDLHELAGKGRISLENDDLVAARAADELGGALVSTEKHPAAELDVTGGIGRAAVAWLSTMLALAFDHQLERAADHLRGQRFRH